MQTSSPYMGREIKKKREELHLTQVEVANAANISERQYQRIEAGESIPSLGTLFSIASIFKVDIKDLMGPVVQIGSIKKGTD